MNSLSCNMEWNQPSVILSIIALLVSSASLGWNIYNKVSADKKKLKISAYLSKSLAEGKFHECCVAVTNIGAKSVIIKNVTVQQKRPRLNLQGFYRDYTRDIQNRPIQSGEERVIVMYDSKQYPFYDTENKLFKNVRIVITDTQDEVYRSKWFIQNTNSPGAFALQAQSGEWLHLGL